jgi:oxalate decarboxylase
LWTFPSGIPHSIQGLEPDGCEFLLAFDDGTFSEFDTLSISDWVAHTPKEVLAKNLRLDRPMFAHIPDKELYISRPRYRRRSRPGPAHRARCRRLSISP